MSRSKPKDQAELNALMVSGGIDRYHKFKTSATQRAAESHTLHGQRLMRDAVPKLVEAIAKFREDLRTKALRNANAFLGIEDLSTEMLAYLTCTQVVNTISTACKYNHIVGRIGQSIADELRYAHFEKVDPVLFDRIKKTQGFHATWTQKRLYIIKLMSEKCPEWKEIPRDDQIKVGLVLFDMFVEHTGFVEVKTLRKGRRQTREVFPTKALLEWIEGFHGYAEVIAPIFLPTIEKPHPWDQDSSIGPYKDSLLAVRFVKNRNKWYQETGLNLYDYPKVIRATNLLQATPWHINMDVLSFLARCKRDDISIPGVPPTEGYEPIPVPEDMDRTSRDYFELKFMNLNIWKDKQAAISKRSALYRVLMVAEQFSHLDQMYFPHSLDFRGRMYPTPTHLNPQANDIAKSLLEFAEGAPILTEQDADWLRVSGANRFGFDKATLSERSEWIKERDSKIMESAKDPLSCDFWREADDPMSFLAFCYEYSRYRNTGYGFITRLPCNLDASNNGLQILSLLSRDPQGCFATNVVDTPKPQDFYQLACDRAMEMLRDETDPNKKAHAKYWIDYGITRKSVKRSVMILPYSGTAHASSTYLSDWYKEDLKEKGLRIPYSEYGKRINYLNSVVWTAIGDLVGKPKDVMAWLRSCAAVFCKKHLPIMWTTPVGFPILQHYPKKATKVIKTRLRGDRLQMSYAQDTNRISVARMKNGISPNVVHSLDAAAMQATICRANDMGITNFAMIHDSYGTTAPDVAKLQACTRLAWHEVFSDNFLVRLRDQFNFQLEPHGLSVPEPPELGSLDPDEVLGSTYFIS